MAARRSSKQSDQSVVAQPAASVEIATAAPGPVEIVVAAAPGALDDSDIRRQLVESSAVKFKLDVFEGPLDLLLYLIKINELDISMVALREITGQYLDHIRMMESLDLELAGDYLVVAATLINIKLRAILPAPESADGEDEPETLDDLLSARQLMTQLIEYRNFKEAAFRLGERAESASRVFFRDVALPQFAEAGADPAMRGDFESLIKAFQRVISFVERKNYHAVDSEEFSVEDKISMLRRRLFTEERLDLVALFRECRVKIEMIVLLLGVLELCKMHEVRVLQGEAAESLFVVHRKDRPVPESSAEAEAETEAQDDAPGAAVIDIAAENNARADDGSADLDADNEPGNDA